MFQKDKECFCYCNSHEILNVVCGQENEIFKKLFVRIDDCPYWSRESLYEIRKKQLDEEKQKLLEEKMAEEQELLERKKGRRKVSKKIKPKKKDFSIFKEIENKFYRNKYLVKLYERIYLKSQIVFNIL